MKLINHTATEAKAELSLHAHSRELQEELTKSWNQFHRTLTTIFPYQTFLPPEEVRNSGLDLRKEKPTREFRFTHSDLPNYNAADLNHPDTIITSDYAGLTLEKISHVAHCDIRMNITIMIPLTEDDKITLRGCGAMRAVTETSTRTTTRTIVSCEI